MIGTEPFGAYRDWCDEAAGLLRAPNRIGVAQDVLVSSADEVEYCCDSLINLLVCVLGEGKVRHQRPPAGALFETPENNVSTLCSMGESIVLADAIWDIMSSRRQKRPEAGIKFSQSKI